MAPHCWGIPAKLTDFLCGMISQLALFLHHFAWGVPASIVTPTLSPNSADALASVHCRRALGTRSGG